MSDRAPRPKKPSKRVKSGAEASTDSPKAGEQASSPAPKSSKRSAKKTSVSPTPSPTSASEASTETQYNPPRWDELEVAISELSPYERNPRKVTTDKYKAVVESLRMNGYHNRIRTTHDLKVVSGHVRLRALKECGYSKVKVLVPNRPLTPEEFKRNLIQDNLPTAGSWDYDILAADFDAQELLDMGMPAEWLDEVPVPDVKQVSFQAQSKVDEGVEHTCPKCGHKFEE